MCMLNFHPTKIFYCDHEYVVSALSINIAHDNCNCSSLLAISLTTVYLILAIYLSYFARMADVKSSQLKIP